MTTQIITREIHYTDSKGQNLIGYLALPEGQNYLAGVLIGPEWWGRNDYIDSRARELAEQGYAAFAMDMYGDKTIADDVDSASKNMNATFAEPDIIVDRASAALAVFAAVPEVNAHKIAAIGFCYGGKVVLDLARSGADLKAVATFHANLGAQQPATAGHFQPEVLVAHGQDDSMVSLDDVEAFKQEMNAAHAKYHVEVYPNAKHGFTNPSADEKAEKFGVDLGYNPLAESESFDALHALLARVLK